LRTRAVPEPLRGLFTTRRYTNPVYLTLPYLAHVVTMRASKQSHNLSHFQAVLAVLFIGLPLFLLPLDPQSMVRQLGFS